MTCYLIVGATGFLGSHFIRSLGQNDQFFVLSRNKSFAAKRIRSLKPSAEFRGTIQWDPCSGPPPERVFDGVNTLVNFTGESVAKGRWTANKKRRIRDSRVLATTHLVQGLLTADHTVTTYLSISAVGYYGFPGDVELTESSNSGTDFLSKVVIDWEAPLTQLNSDVIRVLTARVGVVLGRDEGALPQMLRPFRFFVGGRLGSGKQWVPWIHIADCVSSLRFLIDSKQPAGVYNITGPTPTTNRQLTTAIAKALHRPAIFPMPGPILRILLGGFAEVLLESQKAIPKRLLESGFRFQHPTVEDAIQDLLGD